MNALRVRAVLAGVFLVGAASAPLAHHSVGAEFDVNGTVNIEGTVTKVEWFNPHIWIYLSVENPDGSSAEYQCEGSSPNSLRRRGWTRDSLRPGDRVAITGLPARLDPYTCYARAVSLADGTRLFSGSAEELER
ncbi:MAG TPA: DUF6152 family protein [Gammaproteobacteria bacterium]|jgi:hypothetical protein